MRTQLFILRRDIVRAGFLLVGLFLVSGCASTRAYKSPDASAESNFYAGQVDAAIYALEDLSKSKNKDYALWKNQQGSAYLVKGDYEKAQGAFLDAFHLMNNVEAFKELERGAVRLTGAESSKAYKGDPYEKMYNSFYTGMLLLRSGDLENARAAMKNAILCDSDSSGEQYKSDELVLFLLTARIEELLGNPSLADDYLKQAKEIYWKSAGAESSAQKQYLERQDELKNIQAAILTVCSSSSSDGTCNQSQMTDRRKEELSQLKKLLDEKIVQVEKAKEAIASEEKDLLDNFVKGKSNLFLVVETGRGPYKSRTGQYGEKAVFTFGGDNINLIGIVIDGQSIPVTPFVADVYYQATTRGGRKMDSILKGKAQFKEDSAKTAVTAAAMSLQLSEQSRQQRMANPYADTTGADMAAGMMALFSLGAGAMSHITNPAADVRHWSFLPNKVRVYSLQLPSGTHQIEMTGSDHWGTNKITRSVVIEGDKKNNVEFFRF